MTPREILFFVFGIWITGFIFTFWIKWHTWIQKDKITRFEIAFFTAWIWFIALPLTLNGPHYGGNQHPLDQQQEWTD